MDAELVLKALLAAGLIFGLAAIITALLILAARDEEGRR